MYVLYIEMVIVDYVYDHSGHYVHYDNSGHYDHYDQYIYICILSCHDYDDYDDHDADDDEDDDHHMSSFLSSFSLIPSWFLLIFTLSAADPSSWCRFITTMETCIYSDHPSYTTYGLLYIYIYICNHIYSIYIYIYVE